jgi:hypothetical protein
MRNLSGFAAAALLASSAFGANAPVRASGAKDNLKNYYTPGGGNHEVSVTTCGSTYKYNGCFGSETFGPFGEATAIIEGQLTYSATSKHHAVANRDVYVLDRYTKQGYPSLSVYQQTNVIENGEPKVTFDKKSTVSLPFTSRVEDSYFMVANKDYIFIGSNAGSKVVTVSKKDLAVSVLPTPLWPEQQITGMSVDMNGYVTVTTLDSNVTYKPDGTEGLSGGGVSFGANEIQGTSLTNPRPPSIVAVPTGLQASVPQ